MSTNKRECRYCGRKFIPKGTEHYCCPDHKRLRQRDYQRERRASEPKEVRAYKREWIARRRRDKAFREAERARQRERYAQSHKVTRNEGMRQFLDRYTRLTKGACHER